MVKLPEDFGVRRLVVEGWRNIAHSYAVVNQWQLLALARRYNLQLRVSDVEYYNPYWKPIDGLFSREAEQVIRRFPPPEPEFAPDATYRIAYPYDLSPSEGDITAVFGTAEYRVIAESDLTDPGVTNNLAHRDDLRIVTPSRWSAVGFERLGFRSDQVAIVPHGLDTVLFKPDATRRAEVRKRLGLSGFVFMHMGAMTWNKGVDLVLKAFATIADGQPAARLLLKGTDQLYPSRQFIKNAAKGLSSRERSVLSGRLLYLGSSMSMQEISDLYQAADLYVSPYRAEGFNIPVLEACGCGVPVVCTAGGSTDDFIPDSLGHKVRSRMRTCSIGDTKGDLLEPDLDHLIELMRRAIDDLAWSASCKEDGPRHVNEGYTWDKVVEHMVAVLFPG